MYAALLWGGFDAGVGNDVDERSFAALRMSGRIRKNA